MQIDNILIQGFGVGFAGAAAIGPIALLVIQRVLQRGWRVGVASGLGVALVDAAYGLIGALGLAVVTEFLIGQEFWLRLIGGLILLYLGGRGLLTPVATQARAEATGAAGYFGAFFSIVFLTMSNPVTILYFTSVYIGLAVVGNGDLSSQAWPFAGGVFVGSLLFWLILTAATAGLRARFQPENLGWLNKLTGIVIAGFGIWVLWRLF